MKTQSKSVVRFIYLLLICGSLGISGCFNIPEKISQMFDDSKKEEDALKSKELELKERELALKEQQVRMDSSEVKIKNNAVQSIFTINARVIGSAVQLRQEHSTTAKSLKSMKKNDLIQIIEEFIPNGNYGEAILIQKTDFYDEYYGSLSFSLPKGKAVMVEGRADGDSYSITYLDVKTKRKGYAKISSNLLEFISGKAWYRIKRDDGMTGWVYSEFVERL